MKLHTDAHMKIFSPCIISKNILEILEKDLQEAPSFSTFSQEHA